LARFGGGSTSSCCCISSLVNPSSESESAMTKWVEEVICFYRNTRE
jgi:hypothetical protein